MRTFCLFVSLLFLVACRLLVPAQNPETLPAKIETQEEALSSPGETGGICGGIAGFQCQNKTDYCQYPPGDCRNLADAAGTCSPKPQVCTMQYTPVCGCDNNTYGNACTAAAQGLSVAAKGQCASR